MKTLFIYFSNYIFFCFFEGGIDTSPRLIDRMGEAMARPFLTLAMLMPGTPVVYYGDEIGMRGHNSSQKDQGQRNLPMRTPMQWDATENAGFCSCSTGSPWMPINPTSTTVNVEVTALVRQNISSIISHVWGSAYCYYNLVTICRLQQLSCRQYKIKK